MTEHEFKKIVRHDGKRHFRSMPWRESLSDGTYDPYKILVSEVMLQQTQVSRVIPKYIDFIQKFPNIETLAAARLSDVLKLWSGLGYNRRAKYLHDAAKQLLRVPLPWTYEALVSCKGIGINTAKAVLVYAYDLPEVFIETNIRTVFIHYFFPEKTDVTDKEIFDLHSRTLDIRLPRSCYWALMDIGAYIKSAEGNASAKSATYRQQTRFEGSVRQIRGAVLKALAEGPKTIQTLNVTDTERLFPVLGSLEKEQLIHKKTEKYYLGSD